MSTKSLLGSCGLYNGHEKFLIEGECKLNIKKHRGKRSYSAFHKTFDKRVSEVRLKFQKFTTNLAISLCSCQSNCELRKEVVIFTLDFVGKLQSSSQAKFAPFGVVGLVV